jgi:hypothetical protein
MITTKTPFFVLLAAVLSSSCCLAASTNPPPSEFLQSFLDRPNLLQNASGARGPRKKISKNLAAVSLVVDNWSKYSLVYTAYAVTQGLLVPTFPPRNMPAKLRDFGMRVISEGKEKNVAGMVGWTLTDGNDGDKVSRLSVAWRVKEDGSPEISMALGETVPLFGDMWTARSDSRLVCETASGEDASLVLADSWTTVAVKLSRSKAAHYDLVLSVVPQSVDPWGWIKYYQERRVEAKTATQRRDQDGSAPPPTTSEDEKEKEGQKKPLFQNKEMLASGPTLEEMQVSQSLSQSVSRLVCVCRLLPTACADSMGCLESNRQQMVFSLLFKSRSFTKYLLINVFGQSVQISFAAPCTLHAALFAVICESPAGAKHFVRFVGQLLLANIRADSPDPPFKVKMEVFLQTLLRSLELGSKSVAN